MRAPFDTTCDLFWGGKGLVPYGYRGSAVCRLVIDNVIDGAIVPWLGKNTYLTLDSIRPSDPNALASGEIVSTDYAFADYIAVPSGVVPVYKVILVDSIAYAGNPPYYRAYLVSAAYTPVFSPGLPVFGRAPSIDNYESIRTGMFGVVCDVPMGPVLPVPAVSFLGAIFRVSADHRDIPSSSFAGIRDFPWFLLPPAKFLGVFPSADNRRLTPMFRRIYG